MALPNLVAAGDAAVAVRDSGRWDAVVLVAPSIDAVDLPPVQGAVRAAAAVDARVGHDVVLLIAASLAGGRLVVAPTGPLNRDMDDVRRFADAARLGLQRARDAGATRPLLLLPRRSPGPGYERYVEVALLGGLGGLWEPLEAREAHGEGIEPVRVLGVAGPEGGVEAALRAVVALEVGRRLARDVGGAEPERMSPHVIAESCQAAFHNTPVSVHVLEDIERLGVEYPLLSAVARASHGVPRHRPRVIRLEYTGDGPLTETLLLAGKGLVYDTGGADLKTGGVMAGMSRDKCGAAAVLGLLRTLAVLRPRGLRVVAELGCVRNSVGSDAFVSDEILVSHAGVRVRVGNTDAEGRLVLADLLSHLRETATRAVAPRLFTVATLTGHASRAVGPYPIAMDNGPARGLRIAASLGEVGERWGDPFEISRLRREDFEFIRPRTKADDVLSCNNQPSSTTARGHQFPMAFLAVASGLARHGRDASLPLPYTHIDLGGCATEGGDWQHGRPTAIPVVGLAARWALEP